MAALKVWTLVTNVQITSSARIALIGRVKNGRQVAVAQHQPAPQVLVQDVAQHEAEHEAAPPDSRTGA